MPFDRQPFSSTHPAIDALFQREFAQSQAQRQAEAQAAANETARQQIMAQSQLAQGQQRYAQQQADYNNLFREREFQSRADAEKTRSGQVDRQLGIMEKGLPTSRDVLMKEGRAQAIIDANATAANDAARANALYKIELDAALETAKKAVASVGAGLFGGVTVDKLADINSPDYKAIQKRVFDSVRTKLLAEKGGALNNLIPDPSTYTFTPVRFDSEGNVVAGPFTTGKPNEFDYMGNPVVNPAANPAALGAPNVTVMPPSVITPTPTPTVPAASIIRVPLDSTSALEMSSDDAAEAERQIRAGTPAGAVRDALIKSGRAKVVQRLIQPTSPFQDLWHGMPIN